MYPRLLENGVLQLEYENYEPWPSFRPLGADRIGGLWRAHFLREALCREDLSCGAWRESIPSAILSSLRQFPECHSELLEMAQALSGYYLKLSSWSPAFTLLAATYWIYRYEDRIPSIEERVLRWENLDPDQLLNFTRFPSSKSFLRTLCKIPAEGVYVHHIQGLRDLWAVPEKRRILQHLPKVTGTNIWLLSCFPPIVDPAIHHLAAEQPKYQEYCIREIVSDLSNRREIEGMEHWPYRNQIHSWPHLIAAYNRFLIKTGHVPEIFPPCPIDAYEDDEFEMVPLRSRTALRQEAEAMTNCIEDFSSGICQRKYYAYKLLRPERATVLIKRQWMNRWMVKEAMISANERQVHPNTMSKLSRWVRSPHVN